MLVRSQARRNKRRRAVVKTSAATRTEGAGEAARERACGGVRGAEPLGKNGETNEEDLGRDTHGGGCRGSDFDVRSHGASAAEEHATGGRRATGGTGTGSGRSGRPCRRPRRADGAASGV